MKVKIGWKTDSDKNILTVLDDDDKVVTKLELKDMCTQDNYDKVANDIAREEDRKILEDLISAATKAATKPRRRRK